MVMPSDPEFRRYTVKEINKNSLSLEDGYGIGLPDDNPISIKPGDVARLYGKGFGPRIRGIAIEGKGVVFYFTSEQQVQKDIEWREQHDADKQKELDDTRSERDARRYKLPRALRLRIERFIRVRPNWRRDHESYELMCCEQAAAIQAHFKTVEALDVWSKLDWKQQKALFPDLSEGHSGNSFGFSVQLARLLMTETEDIVIKMHGALCPLVGCEEYGCYAATKDL